MTFALQPTNKNYLSPVGFQLTLTRIPNTTYFCQGVTLPQVGIDVIKAPTPFNALNLGGTSLNYGDLQVTFLVDEDMRNYNELYQWMSDITIERVESQYSKINVKKTTDPNAGPRVDARLTILNSAKAPNVTFELIDVFCTGLTPLAFDTRNIDVKYLTCTATFNFREFNITMNT